MVKVVIKKNIKPKTTKQKQKQTQKTNVTVNIGSEVIKKKRGRPPKRSKIEKQPIKPISQQPIIQSYNQPIFKQSTPQQPSSLATSILASQNIPSVIKEEVKEESTIKKALIDQNISTEEPETKKNDLERVRRERLKKFEKPKVDIIQDEPIRHALFSQMLSDQQDDTEEINALKFQTPEKQSFGTQTSTFERKFNFGNDYRSLQDFNESIKKQYEIPSETAIKRRDILRQRKTITASDTESNFIPTVSIDAEPTNETPLTQPEERGASELITQTETTEPNPLLPEITTDTNPLQPTLELGFGGLTEEPIQTNVGEFLPPEPVSQEQLLRKQQQLPPLTILNPIPYRTERLVKDEGAAEPPPPIAEWELTQQAKEQKPSDYIRAKWRELSDAGLLEGYNYTFTNKKGQSQVRPSKLLLDEILVIEPGWETPDTKKPGAKIKVKKPVEATEI